MQSTELKLHNLSFSDTRTYLYATLFILGNIIMPQIAHLVPQGGLVWLPIYFFTLVGAYKYGWKVGLITALASPLINSAIFGMPAVAMLPVIIFKSVTLAIIAGLTASRFKQVSPWHILIVVFGYQLIGSLGEWAWTGSLDAALQDLHTGLPGIIMQVFAGWLIIRKL